MEWTSAEKRVWAEVDLDALRANYALIRAHLAPGTKLCCVIKANAYGHGARRLARLYQSLGADMLALATWEEALEVRAAGVTLPLLLLGYTPPARAGLLMTENLIQCVFSLDYAKELSAAAQAAGGTVRAHLKLDTGMGRLGFDLRTPAHGAGMAPEALPAAAAEELLSCLALPGLVIEGVFTHFASADEGEAGREFTLRQAETFEKACRFLKERAGRALVCHIANSAGIFDWPADEGGRFPDFSHCFDMVRAGIVLYGLAPDPGMLSAGGKGAAALSALRPAMTLKTVISFVKTIAPGESVSYGRTYVADRPRRIATLPVGYADGLFRSLGKGGYAAALCGGPSRRLAPVVGRICMDQCMIDVTAFDGVAPGDEVALFGGEGLSAWEVASLAGTIAYEVVCAPSRRVPRVYREGGRVVAVENAMENAVERKE